MGERKTSSMPGARLIIVVGIDFAAQGDQAFATAWDLTRARDAEIHLLHALGKVPARPATGRNIILVQSKLEKNAIRLRSYVEERFLTAAQRRGNLILHVRFGAPDKAIIQLAVDVNADLIVVGSRGLHGMQKLVLGSVGESVVKTAPCGVLVARPKKFAGIARTLGISPPCKDCLTIRAETSGAEWWCASHATQKRLPLHVYSFERELPLSNPR
jgi:nucleotide-binding universal stress UspA family protein